MEIKVFRGGLRMSGLKDALAKIELVMGDITEEETEAIVNAANSSLLGGGGVDGAIHRAGGPQILKECREIRNAQGECPPGYAVITSGGNLKAKYVIHTVGPIWQGGIAGEDRTLKNAYLNSLRLAAEHDIKTLAFPSISTGAYRFPVDRAASIAIETVAKFLKEDRTIGKVRFVLFDEETYGQYERAMLSL